MKITESLTSIAESLQTISSCMVRQEQFLKLMNKKLETSMNILDRRRGLGLAIFEGEDN